MINFILNQATQGSIERASAAALSLSASPHRELGVALKELLIENGIPREQQLPILLHASKILSSKIGPHDSVMRVVLTPKESIAVQALWPPVCKEKDLYLNALLSYRMSIRYGGPCVSRLLDESNAPKYILTRLRKLMGQSSLFGRRPSTMNRSELKRLDHYLTAEIHAHSK